MSRPSIQIGHNVFDVTLTDNIQHIYISQFFDTENITHRDKMRKSPIISEPHRWCNG